METRDKITAGQTLKLLLCLCFSPAIRAIPAFEAQFAKQAGWVAPMVAFLPLLILIFTFDKLFTAYENQSYTDIIYDILGKFFGNILLFIYVVGLSILLALYTRYYTAKLSIALTATSRMELNIIVLMIIVYLVLRYGLVIMARMSEVIFVIINISFCIIFILSMNNIKIDNLIPISYLDIIPIMRASYPITGLWSYFTFLCFFADRIEDRQNLKKVGTKYVTYLVISTILLSIMVIGSIGYSVTSRSPIPFFVAVKNISLFGAIERIEAIVVTQWIATDFILIAVFLYVILDIIKRIFCVDDIRYLIKISLVFFYLFSFYIAYTIFELRQFSIEVATHLNFILCFVIPIVIYLVGKIRKKV